MFGCGGMEREGSNPSAKHNDRKGRTMPSTTMGRNEADYDNRKKT
jgi:hypothetical protein